MKVLQALRQQGMTQTRGGQPRRALAPFAQAAAGLVEPMRIERHDPNAIARTIQAGTVVDALRRHQQHIPCPGLTPLAAIDIAVLPLHQQADVIFEVEMPGKGEAMVLGVDQADAGQTALDVSDLFHGAHSSAMARLKLG